MKIDLTKLKAELIFDEGYKKEIYLCPAGLKTGGIGHMIRENEPEFNQPLGTPISEKRIEEWYKKDSFCAISDCKLVFHDFEKFPEELQRILVNMMFNLGINRFKKFKKLIAAIEKKNYKEAVAEMENSLWFKQVGKRAERLIKRMLSL